MEINVTYEDIKKGEPGSPCFCAISCALERQFKTSNTATKIDHDRERVVLEVDNKTYHVDDIYEYEVSRFIESFDYYVYDDEEDNLVPEPKPFSFKIHEVSNGRI